MRQRGVLLVSVGPGQDVRARPGSGCCLLCFILTSLLVPIQNRSQCLPTEGPLGTPDTDRWVPPALCTVPVAPVQPLKAAYLSISKSSGFPLTNGRRTSFMCGENRVVGFQRGWKEKTHRPWEWAALGVRPSGGARGGAPRRVGAPSVRRTVRGLWLLL